MTDEGALETVALSDLVLLPELQPRKSGTDKPTVQKYRAAMVAGAEFPPLLVARLEGVLLLVDGWHRYEAMRLCGVWQTPGNIRAAKSLEQARLWSYQANRIHGLPLKRGELREMFRAYVKARAYRVERKRDGRLKSYRDMESELQIPRSTLQRWMVEDAPAVANALGIGQLRFGGEPRKDRAERRLAREVAAALDHAAAALPGVKDGAIRFHLLERARAVVKVLENGSLAEPAF